jgi:hypothetical protein
VTTSPDLVVPSIFATMDDRRFDDLPAFYLPNVQADTVLGQVSGRDELVAAVQAFHQPIAVYQHLVTGVIVERNGDDAEVRANVVAVFADAEHRPGLEAGSVWRGRLRRTDNAWRVAEFSLGLRWSRGSVPST